MAGALKTSYAEKPKKYFVGARQDFVALLPDCPDARILEIGCGSGGTGALALRDGKCSEYIGVELMPGAAEDANKHLTQVFVADVETDFPDLPRASFDAFIASEVFEHLHDPWAIAEKAYEHLKPGGLLLASSPNIANRKVINALRRGSFEYVDMGVMDRTHLRWFTPTSFAAMFLDAGFHVEKTWPVSRLRLAHKLRALFWRQGQQAFWTQICVMARKPN